MSLRQVTTKRTKHDQKVDIPTVQDPVRMLEHMGKETVRKMSDLAGLGLTIPVANNCIKTVGDFRRLARDADANPALRQKLLQVCMF